MPSSSIRQDGDTGLLEARPAKRFIYLLYLVSNFRSHSGLPRQTYWNHQGCSITTDAFEYLWSGLKSSVSLIPKKVHSMLEKYLLLVKLVHSMNKIISRPPVCNISNIWPYIKYCTVTLKTAFEPHLYKSDGTVRSSEWRQYLNAQSRTTSSSQKEVTRSTFPISTFLISAP